MGGYSIDLSLHPTPSHKASIAAARRAAMLLGEWLGGKLAALRVADTVFGEQLAGYVEMVEPFRVTPTAIALVFSDCGGEAYASMMAAVHCVHRWLAAERDVVTRRLAAANVIPDWTFDGEALGVFATACKQIVRLTDEGKGLCVEVDGDPYTIAVRTMPMRDRKRLQVAWRQGTCICPVCRALGPWRPSISEGGGPLVAAVRAQLDPEAAGYSIGAVDGNVVLGRDRRLRGESVRTSITVVRANARVELYLDCSVSGGCAHGVRVSPEQLAFDAKQRAVIFRRSEALAVAFARQLAAKRAAHDTTYRIATRWWNKRGKTLPAKQFALARVANVMTYPALAELESLIKNELRAQMNAVCVNAAWHDVVVHARER